jgi:hypothetical protein
MQVRSTANVRRVLGEYDHGGALPVGSGRGDRACGFLSSLHVASFDSYPAREGQLRPQIQRSENMSSTGFGESGLRYSLFGGP